DAAAQGHSDYQALNNVISHYQVDGRPGFTGVCLGRKDSDPNCIPGAPTRLGTAGYTFDAPNNYAYGEVISRTPGTSGAHAAQSLIAAIYHRFVVFEPMFREVGVGATTSGTGSTWFTTNFAANGLVPTLGDGGFVVYPHDAQTGVPRSFRSDEESP